MPAHSRFANSGRGVSGAFLPAMIAMTAASLLFAFFFTYRPDQPAIGKQASWALFSGANIYYWQWVGNYWGLGASQSPFLHMWSLSVEEQFYLFFPPTIWLIYKFAPRRLLAAVLFVAVASLWVFLFEAPRHPEATFYLLPPRAWELAVGCALAVIGMRIKDASYAALGSAGLLSILGSYFFVSAFGIGMLIAVFGTALVIAFARSGICFRILSHPLLVYIGKLSYSLYLWHWPIIVFPAYMDRHLPLWMAISLMILLSLASYYFVEKPTRHAKGIVPYILTAFFLTHQSAIFARAVHWKYDTSAFERLKVWLSYYDSDPHRLAGEPTWSDFDLPTPEVRNRTFVEGGILTGSGDPQIVVLGDSCGAMWSPVVRSITEAMKVPASFWVMDGVTPILYRSTEQSSCLDSSDSGRTTRS